MGMVTHKSHKDPRADSSWDGKNLFNSLEPEAHCDPDAKKSEPYFNMVKETIANKKLGSI